MTKHNRMPFLRNRSKRVAFMVIKLTLVFGAGYYIYNRLLHNDTLDFDFFIVLLLKKNIITIPNTLLLLGFSIVNWCLESFKWRTLVNEIKGISFTNAVEQSLGSLTVSIITPNRIGEYGAKAIYFPKKYRKKILGLNLVGNLTQLGSTIIFGCIGFLYVLNNHDISISYYKIIQTGIFAILFLFFFVTYFSRKKHPIKGYSFAKLSQFFKNLQQQTLITTISLSTLKYVVFSHQFYFLIWLFNINVSYLEAMAFISSMYLLVSIIPTIFILDVIVKGSVSVWLFSFVGANEFVVLAITTLMWLLNFAFPTLIGSYFVLHFKLNNE